MDSKENSEFKILIVDDDPIMLRLSYHLLKENHYSVTTAVNGQECLKAIGLDKPDLLLLDVVLTDMNGIDICRSIKSNPHLSSIYVLLFSGIKTLSENMSEGLEAGADGYLLKPLQKRELIARIDAAFRTIKAEKALRESESKYRLLADNMTDTVWLMDMNLKFVYVSPSVEKIRGFTLAELRQLTLDQILTPASFQSITAAISVDMPKILADQTYSPVTTIDLDFYKRDGSIHSLETKMSVIRDENGNPINILGQDRDITLRKRAEQVLQERLKELNCLYSVSALMGLPDISLDEILNKTLEMLTLSMKFPEIAAARIVLEGKTYQSANFQESSKIIASEIIAHGKLSGQVEMRYIEEQSSGVDHSFIIEEQNLLNAIAERLGHMIVQKKAETELINTSTRNEALLDAIPDMMFIFDEKGNIVDFHDENHEILYIQPETFLGKNVRDVLPGDLAALSLEKIASVFETGQSCQATYMLDMKGTPKHFESRYVPCGNGNILSIVRDITERVLSEDELYKKSLVLDQIKDQVVITNLKGDITYVNHAQIEVLGYAKDEFLGSNIEFLGENAIRGFTQKEILENTLQSGFWRGEVSNYSKSGQERILDCRTQVIINSDGKPVALCGIATDISKQKILEHELIAAKERAEESVRLKSAFLANMSHEIRTPMNGILGFASLLKETDLTGSEQQEYINIIEKSGKRMLNIIHDIVDISKIESGQMGVSISETNVNEQIEFIYNFFKPETERKNLQFYIAEKLSSKVAIINTDREKLYAILTNLVKNAIKFTSAGCIDIGCKYIDCKDIGCKDIGCKDIDCKERGKYLKFYIKDTGVGVSKEQRELIFERFRQGSESLTRKYEGAGLGLAISKAYVEMLGGKIWVESDTEVKAEKERTGKERAGGIGSTFYFTLPCNNYAAL